MNKIDNKKSILPALLVVVIAIIILRRVTLSGILRLILVAALILGLLIAVVAVIATIYAVRAGKKDFDKRNGKTVPEKKPAEKKEPAAPDEKEVKAPEKPEAPEITAARARVKEIDRMLSSITDVEVKSSATGTRMSCVRVIESVSEEEAEIRKNRQLFSYYLPTFQEIIEKYLVIERSGTDNANAKEKALSSFQKLKGAFEKMYQKLYEDENLDLSVEERALENIIEKDGLKG